MRILFYSSVRTKKMFFIQSYYRNDIRILKDLGYSVHLSNSIWDFLCFWKYDIAFLYFYKYSFFAALIAKIFWKKVYFTGGIDYLEKTFATPKQRCLQILFFKLCNLLSNASIIVSSTDWGNISRIYNGRVPSNCVMSFHAIDFEKFEYHGRYENKEKIISTIAWMVALDNVFRKGVDKAIKVFSSFVKIHPDYKLVIVGPGGKGSEYILKLINELGIDDKTVYTGAITEDEKVVLLKKSRYYMQLSKYEGFGIAAIEALAAGNIVIHSGNGGLQDALGKFGYKVNIVDEQEILNVLLETVQCNNEQMFFEGGIKYVKEHFSYQSRLNDFVNIVGEVKY